MQLVTRRINWGEDRVMFYDERGQLVHITTTRLDSVFGTAATPAPVP
ncbi:hypothetical protein [Paraburkholderia sp. A2RI-6]